MKRRLVLIALATVCVLVGGVLTFHRVSAVAPSAVDQIVDQMANAIDHYDAVSATFVRHQVVDGRMETAQADITMSMRPQAAARAEITLGDGTKVTVGNDNQQYVELIGDSYRTIQVSPFADDKGMAGLTVADRVTAKGGRTNLLLRPTLFFSAAGMESALYPQQEALGFIKREDAVTRLQGEALVLGRKAQVLVIAPSAVHRELYDTIKFWVDAETGILLKQEYWKGGSLMLDQVATQLTLNPKVDVAKLKVDVPDGANKLSD